MRVSVTVHGFPLASEQSWKMRVQFWVNSIILLLSSCTNVNKTHCHNYMMLLKCIQRWPRFLHLIQICTWYSRWRLPSKRCYWSVTLSKRFKTHFHFVLSSQALNDLLKRNIRLSRSVARSDGVLHTWRYTFETSGWSWFSSISMVIIAFCFRIMDSVVPHHGYYRNSSNSVVHTACCRKIVETMNRIYTKYSPCTSIQFFSSKEMCKGIKGKNIQCID